MNAPARIQETPQMRSYRNPHTGEAVVVVPQAQPVARTMPVRRIAECFAACVVAVLLLIALEVMGPALVAVLTMGPVS